MCASGSQDVEITNKNQCINVTGWFLLRSHTGSLPYSVNSRMWMHEKQQLGHLLDIQSRLSNTSPQRHP